MIRILYIARYHNSLMERKIELMAGQPDLAFWLVRPSRWQDDYGRIDVPVAPMEAYHTLRIPLLGRPDDPHRALYRTMTFGMRAARPDIIQAEEEPDSLAALQIALARRLFAPGAKLVLYSWQNVNRPKRWEVRWVMQRTLRASDAVLCANREAMEVLRQHGYRRQMRVVPAIGVDTRVFSPGPARPAGQGPFVIGYVGRLVAEKGLDTLLAALSHLKQTSGGNLANPVSLLIVGGGPYRAALERQVRDECLGDSVTFTSARPPAQVAELMRQMDVLVLPSRRTSVWKEQFGRVLVEAMACKVPVVGSDSGAIPEVVGEAGLLFPEGDAVALVSCLRRLMESPSLRQGLAEQGYTRTMSLYTQERIADQTAQFYRHMIAER